MTHNRKMIGLILALLFSTLACRAATRLILPDTPTPATETPIPQASATAIITTPQPITCADDSCLEACLERIENTLETHAIEPLAGDYAGLDSSMNLVAYKVEDGKLASPTILYVPDEFEHLQQDVAAHNLVWNYASALLPPDELKWISEYDIFTDGPNGTLAWVNNRDLLDRSRWQLGIDIADSENPVFLTYTLVHEFGHLITLNPEQIPTTDSYSSWYQNPTTCPQFSIPEGCTNPESYMNLFHQKFWVDIYDDWLENVEEPGVSSDAEYEKLVGDFYKKYDDQFVREYAATNIREDMAESFMHFVLETKPDGDLIYQQKIAFFHDFPELVQLRRQMIQNICSYTQP